MTPPTASRVHALVQKLVRASAVVLLVACNHDATTPGAVVAPTTQGPSLASSNALVTFACDSAIAYDATKNGAAFNNPSAATLTYALTLSGAAATGLSTAGGRIIGTPTIPGTINATLVASDASGHTATDQFTIVVFNSGLLAPQLPATS